METVYASALFDLKVFFFNVFLSFNSWNFIDQLCANFLTDWPQWLKKLDEKRADGYSDWLLLTSEEKNIYHGEYSERVLTLIENKAKFQQNVFEAPQYLNLYWKAD